MVLLLANSFQKIAIRLLKGLMVIAILSSCLPPEIKDEIVPKEVMILPLVECEISNKCSATPTVIASNAPVITPPSSSFGTNITYTISAPTATTICHTTDGSNPTCEPDATCSNPAHTYTAPLTVSSTLTLKAIGCYLNQPDSNIVSETYTKDTTPPGPITGFTATQVNSGFTSTLNWTNPTDSDFQKVRILRNANRAANNENDGTIIYEGPLTTYTDTGLAVGVTYFYTAFTYDNFNNVNVVGVTAVAAPNIPAASCVGSECYLFFTATAYNGNLGGISGADSKCNSDTNKPNGSNYKAVLIDGKDRQACKQGYDCITAPTTNPGETLIDWALYPNKTYKRAEDGLTVGTTNSSGTFNTNFTYALSTSVIGFWTGMDSSWKVNNKDCSWWTNTATTAFIGKGVAITNPSSAFGFASGTCSSAFPILCAEQ